MKIFEKFKKKTPEKTDNKKKPNQSINDDFLKNLPPGVKIKKIEIGPKQIL